MTRRRRDPRAEALALTTSTEPRRRIARGNPPAAPATNRRRRDPRAERAASSVQAGARLRYDRSGSAPSAQARSHEAAAPSGPAVRIVEDPAFLVLVVPDQPRGELTAHDRQLVAAGRVLADAGGGAVVVLAPDQATTTDFAEAGADRLIKVDFELFTDYCPERRAASVLDAVETLKPRHVLFAESADGGADIARRVAAAMGERLFPGVQNLTPTKAGRRARGGSSELIHAPARLMTIALDAVPPLEDARHEARVIPAPPRNPHSAPGIRDARPLAVDPDRFSLAEADFIVSAGNGITDWQDFAELAEALGATRGGSRVVCDAGHLPRDRQIGASGTLVTARCYFALGIAGAPQHLQGITEVKHVIAVNTDLHAEMIKRADLAIVADAQAVMPALIRYARERRNGTNRHD
ncbi:electron transfer flavoprotein subunit alpha [Skermanella aerolata]|uniref:Electron transfer flavoprotein subunit alpha n=1 Tax=Skermanella aerolata TaxID=393310 RepID=A0A512E1T6_9PROT|nr:electron transfer flavoprotein subunit alpha/FixB family protein [Skermanella aerolata]KJB91104.1 electron transfer flavoprotein subunit alpha [Skermanella aerolata KACC 11604]GEO42691.1 electron transfer flavoprotein subunit alpha [Skermanella aerolata]